MADKNPNRFVSMPGDVVPLQGGTFRDLTSAEQQAKNKRVAEAVAKINAKIRALPPGEA